MKRVENPVFVTLHPKAYSVDVTKDVGQIPASMARYKRYRAYLYTYKNDDYEEQREKYAPDLNIRFLKKRGKDTEFLDEFLFIVKNARRICVLQMYHMTIGHLVCLNLYKFLNRKGIAYLKLDIDFVGLEEHSRLESWKKAIIRILHKRIDIVSAESNKTCGLYNKIFKVNSLLVPACYVDIKSENQFIKECETIESKKEKIILTAGRLGTDQKATEILLEAFAMAPKANDWKLVLAGTVEREFISWLENYYERNRGISKRIEYVGNLSSKEDLYELYERASIFALPSRWGSAEIVIVEALSRGDYIIMSDQIPPYVEYTDNGKYGMIVPVDNIEIWAEEIDKAIVRIKKGYDVNEAIRYGILNFSSMRISTLVNEYIKNACE